MPTKTAAKATTPKTDHVEQKAWEIYLRLCESPSMSGKTQEYILHLSFERAKQFIDAASQVS